MSGHNEQVIIVSSQPVPNLIPVFAWRPGVVHMLVSERMRAQAARLRRLLAEFTYIVEYHIDPYSMEHVEAVCSSILGAKAKGSVVLNVTGGTKVAALAAFQVFRQNDLPIVYFEPEHWRIVHLHPRDGQSEVPAVSITVEDYLAAYGLNVTIAEQNSPELLARSDLTLYLARELPRRQGLMRLLNKIGNTAATLGNFPYREVISPFYPAFLPPLEQLHKAGAILWHTKEKTITIESQSWARYLSGFWLEEYVYRQVAALQPDDLRRNVQVVWDGTGREPVRNEFDVVLTSNARLFLISCKTSKLASERDLVDKNPVYELDSLKDVAAGLFGWGILVSASDLAPAARQRAEASGIVVIAGEELRWLNEKLRALMN